jgi:hypothetical protein
MISPLLGLYPARGNKNLTYSASFKDHLFIAYISSPKVGGLAGSGAQQDRGGIGYFFAQV